MNAQISIVEEIQPIDECLVVDRNGTVITIPLAYFAAVPVAQALADAAQNPYSVIRNTDGRLVKKVNPR